MKRNIPLSEGFEICFCLIVSEREKRREGESTDRGSETDSKTDRVSQQCPAAESETASQKRKKKKEEEEKTKTTH